MVSERQFGTFDSEGVLQAIRSTSISLFEYFPQQRVIVNAPYTCELFGCKAVYDDVPTSFIEDFVCEADADAVVQLYARIAAGEPSASAEYRMKNTNRWFRVTMTTTRRDEQDRPVEAIGVVENLTDIKTREQQLIEQLVRANQDATLRLESILSGINGGFTISLDDGWYTIQYCSEGAAALQGFTVEELIEHCDGSLRKNIYPEDWPAVSTSIETQYACNNTYQVRYRVRHKDGSVRWVLDSGKRVVRADGSVRHYNLIQDITLEMELNEQLNASVQAFQIAADATGDIVFIFDAKRQSIFVSDAVASEFGVMKEQTGVPYETVNSGIVLEESRAEYIRLHEEMMRGAKEAKGIVSLVTANGETGVFELWFRAMLDDQGIPSGKAVGVYKDITQYYLMAEEQNRSLCGLREEYADKQRLAKAENGRLMAAFCALGAEYSAIYHIDLERDSCMTVRREQGDSDYNGSFSAFFERACKAFPNAEDREQMVVYADRAVLRERLRGRDIISHEYRSTQRGWCRGRFVVETRDEQGEAKTILFVVQRIEEEKQRELNHQDELKRAYEAANRANIAKTTFLSNMSHDIRTPMNAIVGFATIAAAHADDAERVRDCLQKILGAGEHLQSLINEILDMSRIESGKTVLEPHKTSLSEIMRSVMPLIQPQMQSKQLNFYVDTVDIKNEYVYADALKMRQILINVLGNAAKFTHVGGKVSLRVMQLPCERPDYGMYQFVVSDTGIGMSDAFCQRIFEPFERENTATVSGTTGTGLGMAITKKLVDMMDGTIEVESVLGEGSTFTIQVPLALQEGVTHSDRVEELHSLRALVVDDDFQSCDTITKMLSEVGMRSDWTTSARDALLRAKKADADGDGFHAYIVDWLMPDMNGIELVRRIRREVGAHMPIVILTAYDWSEIEQEAREAGVTAFCTKPLFLSDLVNALLGAAQSEEEDESVLEPQFDFLGKRVLVVEDNALNREIAEELLGQVGLQVDTAYDGLNAVEKLKKSAPGTYQLVLMDVQMPVMNGYDATRQIRQSPRPDLRSIPILAMTANAFSEDVQAASIAGMNGHLSKPLDMKKLLYMLRSYLRDTRD